MLRQMNPLALDKRPSEAAQPREAWRVAVRARSSAIERVPLGDRHVLHAPASGAILTTDDLGLAILSDPVAPPAKASCLPSIVVDEILRLWESAGLFNAAPHPFPDPVMDAGQLAEHHRNYASGCGGFSIEADDPILVEELDELLWPFVLDGVPASEGVRLRCVACPGGGVGVFRNGRALWGRASLDAARYLIVREAAEALCGADRVGAVLHGAAVFGEGRALLILGDSGRGKSTLAQGLVDVGCGFLADDHLPLHIGGRHLLAFPTGSAIKRGARDLGEVRRLTALHGDRGSCRDGVSYLQLAPAASPGTVVPLAAIVFPEHVAGAELRMTRMDPESAFTAAIASGSRPSRQRARIAPLVQLFASVPAYALRYGNSAQSIPACLDLLAA